MPDAYPVIERIARVLAGMAVSANADGDDRSAGDTVDARWPEYRDDALAVLKTLREPDPTTSGAVADVWRRTIEQMIDAAQ